MTYLEAVGRTMEIKTLIINSGQILLQTGLLKRHGKVIP